METRDPTVVAIRNSSDIQRAVQATLLTANAARPKNTRKNYDNKQREWIRWCSAREFQDGSVVTEGKLVLYLNDVIEARGNRTGAEALWKTQAALDPTLVGRHPRGATVKELLNTRDRMAYEHKRATFHDRGIGAVQDSYTENDMRNMSAFYFNLSSPAGICDRVDFLLSHALVARSEATRYIQLPDVFTTELKNEGPTPCDILMVTMRQGKTNTHNRMDYGGCMRHKDPEICPIGALALHFFYRFDVPREPFPDMSEREHWYEMFLLNGRGAGITYGMQNANMKKAMKACNIVSSKVTHRKRSSSTVIAERNGATEAQIRRLGRWNAESMEGCYLTTLPKGAMRALAGFNPEGGGFSLKRAVPPVPDELTAIVFPSALQWTQPGMVFDIAGEGFVKLIMSLRNVVLQDAAVIMAIYPTHPIWNHALFRSTVFEAYAAEVLSVCSSPEEHIADGIRRAMPVMANILQTSLCAVGDRLSQLEEGMLSIDGRLTTIMEKGFKIVLNDAPATSPSMATVSPPARPTVDSGVNRPAPCIPAVYTLSRGLQTVTDVWKEYTAGINGGPAVRELERLHGTAWRQLEPERRYFSRRKVFYSAVSAVADEHSIPHDEVATAFEAERKRINKTLDGMMKHLKTCGADNVYASYIKTR